MAVVVGLALVAALVVAALLVIGHTLPAQAPVVPSAQDDTVTVAGVRIRYRTLGVGQPPIVMLHGFAGRLEIWLPLAKALSCGAPVALDLPGFAGSSRPRMSYDLETQARYVVGFLDALGLKRVVLVGQSMGASLAAWIAAHYPDRVSRLVLFSPSGLPGSLHYSGLHGALVRPGLVNRIARFLVYLPFAQIVLRNSLARPSLSVATSYDARFQAALHLIRQPTLLVWSPGDHLVPIANAQTYLSLIPHARLLTVAADAGHGAFRSEPAATAQAVCAFLDGTGR